MWPILLLLLVSCAVEQPAVIENSTPNPVAQVISNPFEQAIANISLEEKVEEPVLNLSAIIPNQTVFDGWLMVQDSGKDIDGWGEEARELAIGRGFVSGHSRAYQTGGATDGQVVQFSVSQYSEQGAIDAVLSLSEEAEGNFTKNSNQLERVRRPDPGLGDSSIFFTETEIIEGLGRVERHFLAFAYKGIYAKLTCGGIDTSVSFANCQDYALMLRSNLEAQW